MICTCTDRRIWIRSQGLKGFFRSMESTKSEDKEARNRIKSAPANLVAGTRLLRSRQSHKRMVSSRGPSRACSRGNYQRSYTRSSKPEAKQTLVSTSIVRTPGYTLTRTPTAVKMDINTSAFFGSQEEQQNVENQLIKSSSKLSKQSSKRGSPTASTIMRAAMLEQATQAKQGLEVMVAELNIQIETIKQEYEQQAAEKEEEFLLLAEDIAVRHKEEINTLDEEHQQEICKLQEYHSELVKTMNKEQEEERGQYEEKLVMAEEKLQESYAEKERALESLELELKELHSDELRFRTEKLQEEAESRVSRVQANIKFQHKQEIEDLESVHKRELDGMMAKYNEAMALKDDFQKSVKKNKKLEKEVAKQKEKVKAAKEQQVEIEMILQNTREKLEELQANFKEKVWKVESNYRDRMDALMMENTLLRRRLLKKTDQFCEYRTNTEKLQAEGIRSTKEKMQIVLRARHRASLSVAMGTQDSDTTFDQRSKGRPSSAPTTHSERRVAKHRTEIH